MFPFFRFLARWFALAGCLIGGAVALMTVASIVGRALFMTPVPGDIELTQFGIALCISLCLPWCQLRGGNIIVDFFTARASEGTQRRLDSLGSLLLASMMALLAWRTAVGAVSVHEAAETTMILGLPMWITYAVLAPGLALTLLIALAQGLLRLENHEEQGSEVKA
ncbi:TRAP transporter small permease [Caldimonas tepidiphila]|uniref:TRAP transporter small permease n=1 Tax=Caldimonas tepidiphila TaxID=2315841 RepID=UPI000E5B2138|nr:TRAP transporter small permease [Caldimonas tepidiphila]